MKRIAMAVVCFLSIGVVRADWLTDQIEAAFVGNAKLAIEFTTRGETQYEFLDNFVEIGKLNGSPIAAVDFGISGTQIPEGAVEAANWSTGIKLHLSPILKNYVQVNSEWAFINNMEIDGRYSYDWTESHAKLGLSLGYPFR